MKKLYQGSCHCGAIQFSYRGNEITRGHRCTCTICSQKGALMSTEAISPDNFSFETKDGYLGLYQYGEKTAKHYFCKECGIYTFHETATRPGHLIVNLGCIDGIDTFSLEAEIFDGKNLL